MAKLILRRVGELYFVPQMQLSSVYLHFSCHQFSQALLHPKLEGGLGRWIKLWNYRNQRSKYYFFFSSVDLLLKNKREGTINLQYGLHRWVLLLVLAQVHLCGTVYGMAFVLYFLDQTPPLNSCYPQIVAVHAVTSSERNECCHQIVAMASVQGTWTTIAYDSHWASGGLCPHSTNLFLQLTADWETVCT